MVHIQKSQQTCFQLCHSIELSYMSSSSFQSCLRIFFLTRKTCINENIVWWNNVHVQNNYFQYKVSWWNNCVPNRVCTIVVANRLSQNKTYSLSFPSIIRDRFRFIFWLSITPPSYFILFFYLYKWFLYRFSFLFVFYLWFRYLSMTLWHFCFPVSMQWDSFCLYFI